MGNRLFDTTVQQLKYEVIKELIRAYDKGLDNGIRSEERRVGKECDL